MSSTKLRNSLDGIRQFTGLHTCLDIENGLKNECVWTAVLQNIFQPYTITAKERERKEAQERDLH